MANKKPLFNSTPVKFTIKFTAPVEIEPYSSIKVLDTLAGGLTFKESESSINAMIEGSPTPIQGANFTGTAGQNIVANFTNNANIAGKEVIITVATNLTDASKVVAPEYVLSNTALVRINDVEGLTTQSNEVKAEFDNFSTVIINNTVANNRKLNAVVNTVVPFTGTVTAPSYDDLYGFVIEANIPNGVAFDRNDSKIMANGIDLGNNVTWDDAVANKVKATFTNAENIKGQELQITVNTKVSTVASLPDSYENVFKLAIADNPATESAAKITYFIKAITEVTKAVL